MSDSPAPPSDMLSAAADELAGVLRSLGPLAGPFDDFCRRLWACWGEGGKLLVAGNGGSCADAMHFCEELVVRFKADRRPLAAIALADATVLTCAGNDFGYDRVFSRQVEALGRPGDVLALLSTSGNSPSVLHAADAARSMGLTVVAFTGGTGGALAGRCDVELRVPATSTARVQEVHKLLYHSACQWVDAMVAAETR